eukprot:1684185-Pyramimonas_sp.AAC.1
MATQKSRVRLRLCFTCARGASSMQLPLASPDSMQRGALANGAPALRLGQRRDDAGRHLSRPRQPTPAHIEKVGQCVWRKRDEQTGRPLVHAGSSAPTAGRFYIAEGFESR